MTVTIPCLTGAVTPDRDTCNECLMSDCDNCVNRCIDSTDCSRSFSLEDKQVGTSPAGVSFSNTDFISEPGYPGNKFVCGIEADTPSFQIFNQGAQPEVSSILDGDTLIVNVPVDSIDSSNGQFMASATFTDTAEPTYPTGGAPQTFKGDFSVKTPNESFVLLQDVYKDTFKQYKDFHNSNPQLTPVDFDFYSIRNLDTDSLARNLFEMVKGVYKLQMFDIQTTNSDRKLKNEQLHTLRKEIDKHRVVIDDLKAVNATSKRNIEINLNKSRRVADTNKVLMIVMIVVGVMIILPILKKAKVMPLKISLGIWCVLLLAVLGYMIYELYMKRANYDEIEYKKRNFAKPTDKEIARSRALAQMSDKDKARCQAFSEMEQELDVPNINIDVSNYYSTDGTPDTCAHIPDNM